MFKVIEAKNEFGSFTIEGALYFSNTQWRKLLSSFIRDWYGKPCKVYPEAIEASMFQNYLERGTNKVVFNSSFTLEGVEFHINILTDDKGNLLSFEVSEPQDRELSCPLPGVRESFVQDEEGYSNGETYRYDSPSYVRPGWQSVDYNESRTAIVAVREDGEVFSFPIYK